MNATRARRPIPLFLTVLIAFFSGFAALVLSDGTAHAHSETRHAELAAISAGHPVALTRKAVALRMDMRKLWEDHITWTRLAIISLTTGSPDTDTTVGRLLQNQTDIGNAVKPFYGSAASDKLTALLKDHILIAADVIAAAKKGDQAALADAQSRWVANADDIAATLNSV